MLATWLRAARGMAGGGNQSVVSAMLYGFNARVGAVANGLEHAMLCAAEAASSTASSGCEAWGGERGCLAVSWVDGDRVCTRRGRRAVYGRVSRVALWRMLGMVAS